ncbi:polyisoprenoid-binding protein [Palleronia sediminis]|uniref:Polyisoprenoid-binding protein n=1 Tax=Palleronia sediminis TaxID=2547833 RepID=A0A4R6AM48_9RHOB|nr:YceI family protein [Palleronia sediminis]TDL83608.1 polyisoprenoid-binding protein [Palleronia sediminis]
MTRFLTAGAIALGITVAAAAQAEPVVYDFDPGHSQIVFTYDHLGFSTNYGMFSGFDGRIMWDEADPAGSSVEVSFPVRSMMTGWAERFEHFMSEEFFGASKDDMVTFTSTGIEVTGDDTARITGDLSMNGVTEQVTLDTVLKKTGQHPMMQKPWLGFEATTTVSREAFGVGAFAPAIGDEVEILISIEAGQAED